jgi:hypothetical protein
VLRGSHRAPPPAGRKVCEADTAGGGLTRRIHQTLVSSLASVLYRSFLFGNFPIPTPEPWRVWQNEKTPVERFANLPILGVAQFLGA